MKKLYAVICLLLMSACSLSIHAQQPASAGTGIVRNDPGLDKIVPPGAKLEKLSGKLGFDEGPVWIRKGGYLLFSDLSANSIMKWTPDGMLTTYRQSIFTSSYPKGALIGTNGLTLDRQGRIIAAEHGNRRVSRFEKDGSVTILADHYDGKRFNSPNDLVIKKNGDIYFTDPTGLARNWPAGAAGKPTLELNFNGVYRITAAGKLDLLTKDIPYPNGLAFSPDEKKLYIDNSRTDKFWMVYDVQPDGTIANGRKFFDATKIPGDGAPDGLKIDKKGNLYSSGPTGVMIFSPQGKMLGSISVPEIPSNMAWGDADGKTLYITARTGLYRIKLKIPGNRP